MPDVGGLAGSSANGTLNKCYSNVNLSVCDCSYSGGLLGHSIGKNTNIKECYATGTIKTKLRPASSGGHIAGLIGTAEEVTIEDAYSNVVISGNANEKVLSGGIIADIWPPKSVTYRDSITTLKNVYYSGNINVTGGSQGGLVVELGWNGNLGSEGTSTNSYWSPEVSGVNTSATGLSRIQAQMKTQANYENWDFEDIWGIDEGTSYPYFLYLRRGVIYNEKATNVQQGAEGATLNKKDKTTNAPIAGVQIGLYDENKQPLKDETGKNIVLTTKEDGTVDLSQKGNLELGKTYYYKEEVAPAGYTLDENYHEFTTTQDGKVTIKDGNTLYNTRAVANSGEGVLTKYKSVNNQGTTVPVVGAVIGLFETDGTKIAELTTDTNGQVVFGATGKLEVGKTYKYKEITAPEGYFVNNTEYMLEVKLDGTVEFKQEPKGIMYNEEKLYLSTSVYTLNNTYMSKIKPKTTVNQLIANCQTNGTIEILDQNGKKLNGTDYVGTGMSLVDTKLDEKIEVKLSVIGDLNGDGKVSLVDIARSELGYIGNIELKDEFLMAADINGNGKHTITDIARLEQYLVGLIEI